MLCVGYQVYSDSLDPFLCTLIFFTKTFIKQLKGILLQTGDISQAPEPIGIMGYCECFRNNQSSFIPNKTISKIIGYTFDSSAL